MRITTTRLELRELVASDYDALFEIYSDAENTRYLYHGAKDSAKMHAYLLRYVTAQERPQRLEYELAIALRSTGALIGTIGVYIEKGIPYECCAGWVLHKDHWQKGYAFEAAYAFFDYCFNTLNMHRIYASCDTDNLASYMLMEKLKMRREACFRKSRPDRQRMNENWFDEYQYGILRSEWNDQNGCTYPQIIERYFKTWLTKDFGGFSTFFADDAVYTECYGPEYRGLEQLRMWFKDWNMHGTVLSWRVKQCDVIGSTAYAEWYFSCEYDGAISGFDGVSVVSFDADNKITRIKEFQSKAEHTYPFSESPQPLPELEK